MKKDKVKKDPHQNGKGDFICPSFVKLDEYDHSWEQTFKRSWKKKIINKIKNWLRIFK